MTYAVGYVAGAQTDIEAMRDNPRIYQVTHRDLRCAYLRPFQYGVHYAVRNHQVVVIACIHASREPRGIRQLLAGRSQES